MEELKVEVECGYIVSEKGIIAVITVTPRTKGPWSEEDITNGIKSLGNPAEHDLAVVLVAIQADVSVGKNLISRLHIGPNLAMQRFSSAFKGQIVFASKFTSWRMVGNTLAVAYRTSSLRVHVLDEEPDSPAVEEFITNLL